MFHKGVEHSDDHVAWRSVSGQNRAVYALEYAVPWRPDQVSSSYRNATSELDGAEIRSVPIETEELGGT